MAASKPTILLIHGAWHTSKNLEKLKLALEAAGYAASVPQLPSVSEVSPPTADLAADTAVLRKHTEDLLEAGQTVVAVAHSYGGQVATNALAGLDLASRARDGRPGGIARLVYLCAFFLPKGKSMIDVLREFGHEALLPLVFDIAEDRSIVCRDVKTTMLGPGVEGEEINAYIASLGPRWNEKCMYDEITSDEAWRVIPVTYIHTTQDTMVPMAYQTSMVEYIQAQGTEVETFTLESGHCPNLTATEDLVDVIKKLA
ncbi:Alpha/beta hydrolase fold-1 [Lasiosphaeris hirsuta]|uniref:Alpha/beta hydrolase fold-1 n=1 Tax=Lasiosphaeris hirsuta TaxID=260670 RepID=A0AA40DSV0_9PEZI|nr:Alpha/beta hydrolase fold-1 [Lasiosphaeris hirsuta]